jgi:hypothetical protein
MAATKKHKQKPARRVVSDWSAVSSVAVAQNGRIVAGAPPKKEPAGLTVHCP